MLNNNAHIFFKMKALDLLTSETPPAVSELCLRYEEKNLLIAFFSQYVLANFPDSSQTSTPSMKASTQILDSKAPDIN